MLQKIYVPFFIFLFSTSFGFSQQLENFEILHDGELRKYSVFLPSSYQTGQSLPMVFNLHGFGSNGLEQILYTSFNAVAEEENFIVVTPEGLIRTTAIGQTGSHWNAYFGTDVDDLSFLDLIIDRVYTDYDIDLARVYSTGMSNGGYMSHRLACELSDRIAAIASVAGGVFNEQLDNCSPSRAVPVMQIHGTNDGIVDYDGIPLFAPSIPNLVGHWVDHNNCSTPADTIEIANISTTDNSTVEKLEYNNGDEGSKVWFYIIDNGGHTWPDATIDLQGEVTNHDFNASEHIWEFFSQFVHPNPAEGTMVLANKNIFVDNIKVVARPISQELAITSNASDILKVRVFDLLGKAVLEMNNAEAQQEVILEIGNIHSGIYVAMVETTSGIFTTKVFF
ncbi:MAG: PHB depolymerase family esterase [Saprospiraceae bacterium]